MQKGNTDDGPTFDGVPVEATDFAPRGRRQGRKGGAVQPLPRSVQSLQRRTNAAQRSSGNRRTSYTKPVRTAGEGDVGDDSESSLIGSNGYSATRRWLRWLRRCRNSSLARVFIDDEFVAFRTSLHPGIAAIFVIAIVLNLLFIYPLLALGVIQPSSSAGLALALLLILFDVARNVLYYRGVISRERAILAGHWLALFTLYLLGLGPLDRLNASGVCWLLSTNKFEANTFCLKSLPYSAMSFIIVPHILPLQFGHICLVFGMNAVIDFFFYGFGLYPPQTDFPTAVSRMIFYFMLCLQQMQLQWRKEQFDRRRLDMVKALQQKVQELRRDNAQIAALMRSLAPTESFHELLSRSSAHRDVAPLCTVVVLAVANYPAWVLQRRPKVSAQLLDVAVTFFDVERSAAGLEKLFVRGDAYGASMGLRSNAVAGPDARCRPLPVLRFSAQVCSLLRETDLSYVVGIGSGPCAGEVVSFPRLSYVASGPAIQEAWAMCGLRQVNVPILSAATLHLTVSTEVMVEAAGSNDAWKLLAAEAAGPDSPPRVASPDTSSNSMSTDSRGNLSVGPIDEGVSTTADQPAGRAVVDLPTLQALDRDPEQRPTPGAALYHEAQVLRAQMQRPSWMCGRLSNLSYARAAASHSELNRNLVLANLCTINVWMFAAAAMSDALRPLSVFFFAACTTVQLIAWLGPRLLGGSPSTVVVARIDLGLVFVQLMLVAAQLVTSGPCVVNARWVYILFAAGFAVIPSFAVAHWAVGGGMVSFVAVFLGVLYRDSPGVVLQTLAACAIAACAFVVAFAQESDLRASWVNDMQSEAVLAVANEDKILHEELLRALLPEYIVPHVQEKREHVNWTCVAETLYDVAMAHIRLRPGLSMETLTAFAHRLCDLVVASPSLGMVSLDGDEAVVAGPLQPPRKTDADLAASAFYMRSQHRLVEEQYANDSTLALAGLLLNLYEATPPGVATTALHRSDGLAVVLGVEQPRFAVLGPVSTVASALAKVAPDGAAVMTESFYNRRGNLQEEWPSGLEVGSVTTWRLQAVGCVRVRYIRFAAGPAVPSRDA